MQMVHSNHNFYSNLIPVSSLYICSENSSPSQDGAAGRQFQSLQHVNEMCSHYLFLVVDKSLEQVVVILLQG